jgi:hypothetical protein
MKSSIKVYTERRGKEITERRGNGIKEKEGRRRGGGGGGSSFYPGERRVTLSSEDTCEYWKSGKFRSSLPKRKWKVV